MNQVLIILLNAYLILLGAMNGTQAEREAALIDAGRMVQEARVLMAPAPVVNVTSTFELPPGPPQTNVTSTLLGSAPVVLKDILTNIECREDVERNPFCNVYVYFTENGKMKADVQVTVTADDQGTFSANGAQNTNSQLTRFSGFPKPGGVKGSVAGAFFQYRPAEKGKRTLTITAEGITKTFPAP